MAEARPVNRCDDWLEELKATFEGVDRGLLPEGASKGASGTTFPDVGTSTEGSASSGQDSYPGLRIIAKAQPGCVQLLAHLAIDGVHTLRPVVGNGDHMVVLVIEHGVWHSNLLWHAYPSFMLVYPGA